MGYIDFFKPDRKETVYVSIINYGLNSKIHCLVLRLVKFSILNEIIWNYILCSIIIPCFQPFVSFSILSKWTSLNTLTIAWEVNISSNGTGNKKCASKLLTALTQFMSKFFILKALSQQLKEIGNVIFYCIYIPCFQPYFSKFNFVYQMNHFETSGNFMGNIDFFKPVGK